MIAVGIWLLDVVTDRAFLRRLPVRMGMSEAEIVGVLGRPDEVVLPHEALAHGVGSAAYGYAALAGDCGRLSSWHGWGTALVRPALLPTPTGKLLWFHGKSVLVAGYYLDASGRLACVVLGKT